MIYSFYVQDAVDYGDRAAILIYNLKFWIRKNQVDSRNQHEIELTDPKTGKEETVERTWTYLRREQRRRLFPFWSERQFYLLIDKLVMRGVLLESDRFNKMPQDRTKWLAFRNEEAMLELFQDDQEGAIPQMGDCNSRNAELQFPKRGTAISENVEAIPDDNPDSNPDHKPDEESSSPFEEFLRGVNSQHHLTLKGTKAVKRFYTKIKDVFDPSYLMDHIVGAAGEEFDKRGDDYSNSRLEHFIVSILKDNDRVEELMEEYQQSEQRRLEEKNRSNFCPHCGVSMPYDYCIDCGYMGWEDNEMTVVEHQLMMFGFWQSRDEGMAEKFRKLLKHNEVDIPRAVSVFCEKYPELKGRFDIELQSA